MIQKFLFACLLIVSITSCEKTEPFNNDPSVAQSISNVSYGPDLLQKMDIYLPASRSSSTTKAVILIHGGGWTSGDKNDFISIVDTLKRRFPGYAIFNINYRLSSNPFNLFPTQEMDVKSAVEYIYDKSSEYQVSTKYVMMGASAGAHLAMLHAYKYQSPVKVKAVVSFFGPADLTDMYNNPAGNNSFLSATLAQAIGATPAQNPGIYYQSSPINFISSNTGMPTILVHGGADPLVKASQSGAIQTSLTAAGIVNQYVYYPAGGHGDWDALTYADAFNKIQWFIDSNVP